MRTPLLTLCTLVLTAGALAQTPEEKSLQLLEQRYRKRLEELETRYRSRLRTLEDQAAPAPQTTTPPAQGRRGIGQLGQTTIFDNLFNPALSLSADFALAGSTQRESAESETVDRFHLRSIEMGIVGRVDPLLSYQLYVHFDEETIEVEEGYLVADNWLPDTFELKVGRFNLDFGKLSPIHDHDLDFLDKPQVLQEYLGGSLRGTGTELHHWFPIGDSHLLRWTLGFTNELDGDAHSTFGPAAGGHHHEGEGGVEPIGSTEFENFAFHGRASALLEISASATLQIGVSAAWAPEMREFFESGGMTRTASLERLLLGADVTFKQTEQDTGRATTLAAELLVSKRDEFDSTTVATREVEALGFYAYAQRNLSQNWALGISGGRFEHAEDSAQRSWDAGGYATWRANEFNRLRLEIRHFDDPTESFWGATIQWSIILGSHGHGIDW